MNIYVCNCCNTYNYGSMMMGENFIHYFNEISKEANNYYVETDDEKNIDRLKYATEYSNIYPVKMNSLYKNNIKNYEYILGYFKMKKVTSEMINQIDLLICLGGDDFTEDYGWKGPILYGIKFNLIIRMGIKVILLGQTMGPYSTIRIPIMKKLLKKIDYIYVRESLTYDILKDMKLENFDIMDDLALLPLSKQEIQNKTREYITFCPSELIYRYASEGNRDNWIEYNLYMIELILNKFPDKKLVMIAHVLKPEHVDDRKILNELYSLVENKYGDRIIKIAEELYPYQVRNYIQQSLFTISSRMHPIISSLQCEVPIIAISYSSKYWGIIGKRYNLEDYIIDVRFLEYKEMKDMFYELVEKIINNYDNIQNKMNNKNKYTTETIKLAMKKIKI